MTIFFDIDTCLKFLNDMIVSNAFDNNAMLLSFIEKPDIIYVVLYERQWYLSLFSERLKPDIHVYIYRALELTVLPVFTLQLNSF